MSRMLSLSNAVFLLTADRELWREAWSIDPASDSFHKPLRIEPSSGRLMSFSGSANHSSWHEHSMTVADVIGSDWIVRPAQEHVP